MEFNLLGEKLVIAPAREIYNYYRVMFQQEADQALKRFQAQYKANTSLEQVVERAPDQIMDSLAPTIDRCIHILVDHGILTVDKAHFCERYENVLLHWVSAYEKISDQYADIVMTEDEKDQYRTARRKYRSRWSGGGFGVSGAIKGAATAGALNMVSGAGHMLFNGIAKVGSSIAASSKMSRIFNDSHTATSLYEGLWETAFRLHYALIHCLAQYGKDDGASEGLVSEAEENDANAILSNIPHIYDQDQRKASLIQSFQIDPYLPDWYCAVLQQFGDQDGSLETISNHFGLPVVRHEKERQLNAFTQSLPLDTEEQAVSALQKVEQEKIRIGFSGETDKTRRISDAVIRFDTEYRTVEGITFPTREDADVARCELSAIQEIEDQINYHDLDSIAEGEQKLKAYTSSAAQAHQRALHQKWTSLDMELRTVDTFLPGQSSIRCKTYEQAETLRSQVGALYKRLMECGEGPGAEPPLLALREDLRNGNYPSALIQCYEKEISSRLDSIDLSLRTTLGKEYPTRKAARDAEAEYNKLKSDFVTGSPRKNGAKFRQRIEQADFSDAIRKSLLDELFPLENAAEIKTAKAFSNISAVILLALVVGSYFFHLSGTADFAQKDVVVNGVSLMLTDVEVVNHLNFMDGLKNGIVVFGRCIGDIFVNGFFDYINGFDYGLLGNIIWVILGIFWVAIKQLCLCIAKYLVSLVTTLIQVGPFTYHLGYVLGSAIPLAVSQLSFDEDDQEGNVKRIKGWTKRKVILTILVVLAIATVSAILVRSEL